MNIRSVINAIEEFAPRALQEPYDNSGLQAGDAAEDCTGALLTLDVSEQTVAEAGERGCNLILSHHPLLFKGLKSVTSDASAGRILTEAIRKGIAVYSAHTSLDNARHGVSARMAEKIGLTGVEVLRPQTGTLAKLAVFVPDTHADAVKKAIADAGAGEIGDYDRCCYSMRGTGSFRAKPGANPFAGHVGEIHDEPETKIEAIMPKHLTWKVVAAMITAHPYEEPAFDIFPLDNVDRYAGSGAVGDIRPVSAADFLVKLKAAFRCPSIRYCGDPAATIRRVALCGGSGAPFIGDAIARRADIFVTGDVKYHDFTENASRIMIADIGHYESEQCAKEILADIVRRNCPDIPVFFAETDRNTIKYI